MPEPVLIQKASGEMEPFDAGKLKASLSRAGTSPELIERILDHVEAELSPGMTTSSIYKHAFSFLKKKARVPAIKYSMPRSVIEFGPSGYPFEDFIAELLRGKGYAARTRVIMRGACVEHEVDVVIEEKGKKSVVEAKFHNMYGIKSDVKIPLYIAARVEDLQKGPHAPIEKGWLVTNTKFTARAIVYGVCAGLMLIGWDYPAEGNLHDLISETGLYPLTALTSLASREKRELLSRSIVLCRDVPKNTALLKEMGIPAPRIASLLKEVSLLCGTH